MHAYAATSPVFDAMAAKAFRDSAGEVGTFCTGCHTPQGTDLGEPGSTDHAGRSDLSREGVTCDVCHTAVGVHAGIGNGPPDRDLGGPKYGPLGAQNMEHETEYSAFVTSPELCGSCHDVFAYPSLQIEQAYTEYVESPARQEDTRCQDCHMGPTPGMPSERQVGPAAVVDGLAYPDRELSSHRFVGPDYSLIDAFPYADDLDASALAQEAYADQVQALLNNAVTLRDAAVLDLGEVRVVLESTTDGHRVPTGFTSERQLWVEVEVTDRDGAVVFRSGDLDAEGNLRDVHSPLVRSGSVELDEQLVNLQSQNLAGVEFREDKNEEPQDPVEVAFPFEADWIQRRSLEPREARQLAWTFDGGVPPYAATVTLHYRNLPPYVLTALQLDDLVPRLRIFTLATVTAQ